MKTLEDWKTKIAALWIVLGIIGVWMPFSEFYTPGYMEEIISGFHEGGLITPDFMVGIAIIMLIPLVMAVLSLTLKDKANHWANIILGAFYAVFILFELAMNVTTVAYPYAILMDVSVFAVAALVVWFAFKWK